MYLSRVQSVCFLKKSLLLSLAGLLKINLFTGSVPPPVTQPLTPLHPPSRPPLGPPPVGGPPLIRPSTVTAGAPSTQSLLHSATNQEGKKQFALFVEFAFDSCASSLQVFKARLYRAQDNLV